MKRGVKNVIIMDGRVPHSILMELLTDDDAASKFINGVIPSELANAAKGAMLPGA